MKSSTAPLVALEAIVYRQLLPISINNPTNDVKPFHYALFAHSGPAWESFDLRQPQVFIIMKSINISIHQKSSNFLKQNFKILILGNEFHQERLLDL